MSSITPPSPTRTMPSPNEMLEGTLSTDFRSAFPLQKAALAGAAATAATGLFVLLEKLVDPSAWLWRFQKSALTSPWTAMLFLLQGGALFYYLQKPLKPSSRACLLAAGSLGVLFSALSGSLLPLSSALSESVWWAHRMSPLEARSFFFMSFSLLSLLFLKKYRRIWGDLAGGIASVVVLIHGVILAGYTYSIPFVYSDGWMPSSLFSAVGFSTMSASLIGALGTRHFPLHPLSGNLVRAKLLRTFLPIGIGALFIYGLLLQSVFQWWTPTVMVSMGALLATLLAAILISLLVVRTSDVVSRQIEQTMRESEHRYQAIIESLKDYAIFMLDPEGHVVTWNKGAERCKGYRAEEIIGEHFSIFYTPADHARDRPAYLLQQALKYGSYEDEGWRVRKDGSYFWASIMLSAIYDGSGRLRGFSKVVRDISERKKTAEILRQKTSLIELLQTISSAANEASRLEQAQVIAVDQVCRYTGWPVGHSWVVSRDGRELVSTRWHFASPGRFEELQKETRDVDPIDLPGHVLKTGKPVWITHFTRDHDFPRLRIAQRLGLKAGFAFSILNGTNVVGILEFFAEKREEVNPALLDVMLNIGAQLGQVHGRQKTNAHISTSLEEKEVLLKEIHHRVKNNLQIITSLLRLQSAHTRGPSSLAMFRESQNRVRSMALIHEYLYQASDLAHINFSDYVKNLVTNLVSSFGLESTSLDVQVDIGPVRLNLDTAIPCGLIITELVSNALKYAFLEKRSQRDQLLIRFNQNADGTYQLKVKDNGVGLPENISVENTSSLGLRLVRALTHQVGGTIYSQRTQGTEFDILFKE